MMRTVHININNPIHHSSVCYIYFRVQWTLAYPDPPGLDYICLDKRGSTVKCLFSLMGTKSIVRGLDENTFEMLFQVHYRKKDLPQMTSSHYSILSQSGTETLKKL